MLHFLLCFPPYMQVYLSVQLRVSRQLKADKRWVKFHDFPFTFVFFFVLIAKRLKVKTKHIHLSIHGVCPQWPQICLWKFIFHSIPPTRKHQQGHCCQDLCCHLCVELRGSFFQLFWLWIVPQFYIYFNYLPFSTLGIFLTCFTQFHQRLTVKIGLVIQQLILSFLLFAQLCYPTFFLELHTLSSGQNLIPPCIFLLPLFLLSYFSSSNSSYFQNPNLFIIILISYACFAIWSEFFIQ